MRTSGLMLAASFAALLPAASAGDVCHDLRATGQCSGTVCADVDDPVYDSQHCVDLPNRCHLQSDCCDRTLGGGFWCPDPEDS